MDTNTTNDEANGDKKKKITFRLADPNTGEISSNERVYSGDLKVENGATNIQIGNNLILDIGRIEWNKPEYHSDRYIYPIGYKAQRHYASYMRPDERVVYTCEILEGEKVCHFYTLLTFRDLFLESHHQTTQKIHLKVTRQPDVGLQLLSE
jgi:hypothetical protein